MKNFITIIIMLAVLVFCLFVQNKYFPSIETETVTVRDTFYNDTIIYVSYPKPYPVYTDTGSTTVIELPADSLSIVKAYIALHKEHFSIRHYIDTLKNDTLAFIAINETVSQNEIQSRSLVYQNRSPTVINTTTTNIIINKRQLYIGSDFGVGNISPGIILKTKKELLFKASYDFAGTDKGLTIGVYASFSNLIK